MLHGGSGEESAQDETAYQTSTGSESGLDTTAPAPVPEYLMDGFGSE
jgi:hypothetical protein